MSLTFDQLKKSVNQTTTFTNGQSLTIQFTVSAEL